MAIEIIKKMITNSTWIDPQKQVVYKFSENNQLCINGKTNLQYLVKKRNKKIILQLSSAQMYVIEYVNDFILHIYSREEKFVITPA
jgi:phosphodiesterase/alkaline phosphatase D-like protein